jgi:hypothetical protein
MVFAGEGPMRYHRSTSDVTIQEAAQRATAMTQDICDLVEFEDQGRHVIVSPTHDVCQHVVAGLNAHIEERLQTAGAQ